ncbi:FAD-binding oxidoreductase [Alcaligenaceae bacterium]|nr:FAD-binding oxidoreductase [Alcaligenaceae bacterium]
MTACTTQVVIIGAGIQGSAAARELAARGVDTIVLEADYAGRHASGVNAGGVRTLNRHVAELPLALASKKLWQRISEMVDDDCGYRQTGQLQIAIDEESFERFRIRNGEIARAGLPHMERLLTPSAVRELVPDFVGPLAGGAYVGDDGYALPFHTTQAFRRKAQALGARFIEGATVNAAMNGGSEWCLSTKEGHEVRAKQVLNCAGAWATEVGKLFGDDLRIKPNGSMQIVTSRLPRFLSPVVGITGQSIAAKQFENGTVVIGGGRRSPVDIDIRRAELTLPGLVLAARQAAKFFPLLNEAIVVRCWSGIEGFTPDGLPLIGFGNAPNVVHAAGFSAHGFQLGPAVGMVLADLITVGRSSISLDPFALDRFQET